MSGFGAPNSLKDTKVVRIQGRITRSQQHDIHEKLEEVYCISFSRIKKTDGHKNSL